MLERHVLRFVLRVDQRGVPLIECSAASILAREPDRCAFEKQSAEGKRLRHSVIHRTRTATHLQALIEKPLDLGMDGKPVGISCKRCGNFAESRAIDAGVDLVFRLIAAAFVGLPVGRQLVVHRLFRGFAADRERFVEFLAHLRDGRSGIKASLAGINLPERRMVFNFCVEQRLRNGRIVYFAMAVAAEADEIDDHVTCELRSVIGGNFAHADDGIGIFSIHVENGDGLTLGQIGGEARGVEFRRAAW